jgi:hypothetical protein
MASRYGDIIINKDGKVGQLNSSQQYLPNVDLIAASGSTEPITQIKNSDGTVGTISRGQLIPSSPRNKLSKISSTKKYTISDGGGLNNLASFITKMQEYKFAPPSDNFWSVKIQLASSLASTDAKSLIDLYDNIMAVHSTWKNKMSSNWSIETTNRK